MELLILAGVAAAVMLAVRRREALALRWQPDRHTLAAVLAALAVFGISLALLVLPGPAMVVIPVGLAILSLEFAWARRWLQKIKETAGNAANLLPRNDDHADRDDDTPAPPTPRRAQDGGSNRS
mgnify:CR=1 FL=1